MLELQEIINPLIVALLTISIGVLFGAHFQLLNNNPEKLKVFRNGAIVCTLLLFSFLVIYNFSPPKKTEESKSRSREGEKPMDFDKFIELLKNEGYTHKRLTLLNEHSEVIPNQISTTDLKRILTWFYGDSKRFEVLKILKSLRKLKKNYTKKERSEIKGMFNKYIWDLEVKKWFNGSR